MEGQQTQRLYKLLQHQLHACVSAKYIACVYILFVLLCLCFWEKLLVTCQVIFIVDLSAYITTKFKQIRVEHIQCDYAKEVI